MARRRVAGALDDVLAGSEEPDDRVGKVRELRRVGRLSLREIAGQRPRVRGRRQAIARLGRESDDAIPPLGRLHHAADRRGRAAVEEPGADAVGRDHQILDERLRAVRRLRPQVAQRLAVEERLHLDRLEIERAVLVAEAAERLRHPVLQPQLRLHAVDGGDRLRHRAAAVQPRVDGVVGELRAVRDPRAVHVRSVERSVGGDDEVDDHRQSILPGGERRQIRRELFRQHRKNHGRRVDRRRVHRGVPIDGRAFGDEGVDVGDRDEHPRRVTGERLGHRQLIEVARVVVVDRAPEELAQVPHGLFGRLSRCRERRRLGQCVGRKIRIEAAPAHRRDRDVAKAIALGAMVDRKCRVH